MKRILHFFLLPLVFSISCSSITETESEKKIVELTGAWKFHYQLKDLVTIHDVTLTQDGSSTLSGDIDLVTKVLPLNGTVINTTVVLYYTLYQYTSKPTYIVVGEIDSKQKSITGTLSIMEENTIVSRFPMSGTKKQ